MDRWDPSQLTLPPGIAASPPKSRKGRRVAYVEGRFIKGPIDVPWIMQTRKLGVTVLWVGLGLWYLRGLKRSDVFLVSNVVMADWGVSSDAKARALRSLEKAGLITVARRGKRSPRVTLVIHRISHSDGAVSGRRAAPGTVA